MTNESYSVNQNERPMQRLGQRQREQQLIAQICGALIGMHWKLIRSRSRSSNSSRYNSDWTVSGLMR